MTQPQAATAETGLGPRLSLAALLEARRLTTTYLSSLASRDVGGRDGATMGGQGHLFDDNKPNQTPQLKEGARQKVTPVLVNWMRALAKTIETGASNGHDKR